MFLDLPALKMNVAVAKSVQMSDAPKNNNNNSFWFQNNIYVFTFASITTLLNYILLHMNIKSHIFTVYKCLPTQDLIKIVFSTALDTPPFSNKVWIIPRCRNSSKIEKNRKVDIFITLDLSYFLVASLLNVLKFLTEKVYFTLFCHKVWPFIL